MVAGAPGSIIGQRIEQFDNRDRCLPRRSARLALAFAPVLFLGTIVLTACAWDPPTIERTPRDAAGAEPSAKSRLAARKGTPQNGTASGGATGEKIDVPGTDMAALEVDLTNFKERLIGLDSDEINDLMGTPSLERAEPPALIWQYRHQVCTVDIFMFDDGGGSTVDHVEVRPTTGASVNDKECFTALLRNVPQTGAVSAKAGPPIASAPSTPVGRRSVPSAAPPSGPAQTPSSSRPPVPSTAAPSAAPVAPARPSAAAAPAVPEGEEGPPPTDTDIDFDFGAANAAPASSRPPSPPAPSRAPSAPPSAAPPSAAPSSEAIPTLPPDEFPDTSPPNAPSANSGGGDDEFADPLDSAPPKTPASAAAANAKPSAEKPAAAAPIAKPAPAPLAAVAPAPPPVPTPPPATPAVVPPSAPASMPTPTPIPTAPSATAITVPPPAAPSTAPAPLSPRGATATAQAQPKGAAKGAAKGASRQLEDIDDDELPDALGRRANDPSHNNEDMVE